MTVAHLGLQVDSGSVTHATPELQKMANAAKAAENAALQLGRAAGLEDAAVGRATAASKMHAAALQAQAAAARMASNTSRQLAFQLNDVVVSLASGMNPAMVALQQGSQISQLGLREVGNAALGMVTKFAPLIAVLGVATAAIAGVTHEINETSAVTVEFGDVALAAWQLASSGIYTYFQPAIAAIAPWFDMAWQRIKDSTAGTINLLVKGWLYFEAEVQTMAAALPHIFDISWEQIYNGGINMMERLLKSMWSDINKLLVAVGQSPVKVDLSSLTITEPDKPDWQKDLSDRLRRRKEAIAGADYAGQFFGAVSGQAQKNALARQAEDAEKATKSLADNGFGHLIGMTNTFADATTSAFRNLGTGIIDAFKKGGDVAGNFFSMILDRVGQVGESLLNTGLNSLLDIGINAIFGGMGGGLGSGAIGRGVYGGMGGFFPAFPGMADGGKVAGAGMSWVGERGPELLRLPRGAEIIPNGPSMAMAANHGKRGVSDGGAANQNAPVQIEVLVSVDQSGQLKTFVQQVAGQTAQVVVKQAVPGMIKSQAPLAVAKANIDNRR